MKNNVNFIAIAAFTLISCNALAGQPPTKYDPSHDPDQNMSAPQTPKDVKSSFASKGNDCGADFNVTDAFITHFGEKKGSVRWKAAVFLISVRNEAYAKNIYVTPTGSDPLHAKSLAQPFKGAYDSASTSFVYTGKNAAGLDTFTVLDDRIQKGKTFVYDLSVEMNGKVLTCSSVTITKP